MLDTIRDFFRSRLETHEADGSGPDSLALATAALMIEVSRADTGIDEAERIRIRTLLHEEFGLPDEDLDRLQQLAEAEVEEATDLFQFTGLVNRHYGQPERIALVRNMWAVARADGRIDDFEEHPDPPGGGAAPRPSPGLHRRQAGQPPGRRLKRFS
ncbi:MAG: TerB family tellurite resistance protein [Gammaproteobacteria bacterium]|nr:TerB family tellurite resistance protein [Gammaproteobacteria bacterium]